MTKLKHIAITSLILVSFTAFAGQGDDRKNENSTNHRVTTLETKVEVLEASDADADSRLNALEASDADLQGRVSALEASDADTKSRLDTLEAMGEFLYTWVPQDGSPDCGIVWEGYQDFDGITRVTLGGGKDTYPPSFTGEYSGDLTHVSFYRPGTINEFTHNETTQCLAEELPIASSSTDIVAIAMEGDCSFLQKAQNADDRGYGAVIIMNNHGIEYKRRSVRMTAPDGISTFPIPTIFIREQRPFETFDSMVFKGPAQFCSERPNREWLSANDDWWVEY